MSLRYRALVLANWEYSKLQPLKGPKNDHGVLFDALTHPQFGLFKDAVTVKTNLRSSELGDAIFEFLKESLKEDYLLIYYSGHGGLRGDNMLQLCGGGTSNVQTSAFDTPLLPRWIKEEGRDRPTIMVLDCCFAGQVGTTSTKAASAPVLSDANLPGDNGLLVLTSGGRTPSPDAEKDDEPSPYTRALADILVDSDIAADDTDGFLTGMGVHQVLGEKLRDLKPRWKGGGGSSPFRLARRPRPLTSNELIGWPNDLEVETLDVKFGGGGGRGRSAQ